MLSYLKASPWILTNFAGWGPIKWGHKYNIKGTEKYLISQYEKRPLHIPCKGTLSL